MNASFVTKRNEIGFQMEYKTTLLAENMFLHDMLKLFLRSLIASVVESGDR